MRHDGSSAWDRTGYRLSAGGGLVFLALVLHSIPRGLATAQHPLTRSLSLQL